MTVKIGVQWDYKRPNPHAFGGQESMQRLGGSSPSYSDAYDLDPTSTPAEIATFFNTRAPWSGMQRYTSALGDRLVHIPKFFYYVDTTGYDAGFIRWWVTDTAQTVTLIDGTTATTVVHPAFVSGSTTYSQISVGAYEGTIISSKLCSIAGNYPTTGQTPAALHTAVSTAVKGYAGYSLFTYQAWCAVMLLMIVEYASLFPSWYIGMGITNMNAVTSANHACRTGHTSSLNNTSGGIEFAPDYGSPGYPAEVYTTQAVNYRGIENLWGNTTELLDGALINNKVLYVRNAPLYHDGTGAPSGYTSTGISPSTTAQYIRMIDVNQPSYRWTFSPIDQRNVYLDTSVTPNVLRPTGDNPHVEPGYTQVSDFSLSYHYPVNSTAIFLLTFSNSYNYATLPASGAFVDGWVSPSAACTAVTSARLFYLG